MNKKTIRIFYWPTLFSKILTKTSPVYEELNSILISLTTRYPSDFTSIYL